MHWFNSLRFFRHGKRPVCGSRRSIALRACLLATALLAAFTPVAMSGEQVLDPRMHHLRSGAEREWTEFPEQAEADHLEILFTASPNAVEQTLRLRHRDLKQTWKLLLNDRDLGRLPQDENEMITFWSVPPGTLRQGENRLRVTGAGKLSDDVLIGDVRLIDRPRLAALSVATLDVSVSDADDDQPLPCRITITDAAGALMTVGRASDLRTAVRPGVVYTADGHLRCGLPAGKCVVYAGRGFEYSVMRVDIEVDDEPGPELRVMLKLRRQVPTQGYVCCDTHCHTLTHSGHGDATLAERMVTLAGEGIELAIATDHNIQIDYRAAAREAGVQPYFTPVIGNEVTTPRIGHFNVFPIDPGSPVIDHTGSNWESVFRSIHQAPGVQVIVLNHPRDVHGGFRPFGPAQHIGPAGENLNDWKLEANAVELINSGALQSDPLLVYRDWFGLLNRGLRLTGVGSSDSHDVARHFVGQGRTYIRCDDSDPSQIDVAAACRSLSEGRALVSLGLLAEVQVEDRFGPGDLAPVDDALNVHVRVLGPDWTRVRRVLLFLNGSLVREAEVADEPGEMQPAGLKWEARWTFPRPAHDAHLVVVALGPGVKELYWPIPKSYQPSSPDWHSYVLASSGVVWLDADSSGTFTSAFEYAAGLVGRTKGELAPLLQQLADYDEAVAIQAASQLRARGVNLLSDSISMALRQAAPQVREGFEEYRSHLRHGRTDDRQLSK